ncbi:MAG: helix-turn-helix transcriptional regulator [Clostridiales bacterium]|nr:helix-turn-helix transcriptional regulator [Clostridiales bacterium]
MTLEKAFAVILKKNRLKCGLSQEELAQQCNIDRTYISLLERGKRRSTLNILFKICKTINMKVSDFILEIEDLMNSNNED